VTAVDRSARGARATRRAPAARARRRGAGATGPGRRPAASPGTGCAAQRARCVLPTGPAGPAGRRGSAGCRARGRGGRRRG